MSANAEPSPPSLLCPDFSGLWSVSKLGKDNATLWSKLVGTFVLMIFTWSWVAGFLFPFFVLFLLYIEYYAIAIVIFSIVILPYLFPISPQPFGCRLYSKYGASYFDGGCSLSFEAEPRIRDPQMPMCAALHPHGLLTISYFLIGTRPNAMKDLKNEEMRKEIMGCVSKITTYIKRWPHIATAQGYLLKSPIFNLLVSQVAGVVSVSRKSMKALMTKKRSFLILPGGFDEASLFKKGENAIFIRKRKGFIKYCLQFGYEIVPVYLFGECETYHNVFQSDSEWATNLKSWLSKRKMISVFPVGPYWFLPFLPFANIGLHAMVSKNTRCARIDNPTQEQIDEVHAWYVNEMDAVFERNKWRFGYAADTKLKIF